MKSFVKKSLLLTFFLVILFFPSFRFHCFTRHIFQNEMKLDTLSMHYTIAHPENYGIPADHSSLTPYSKEQEAALQTQLTDYSKTLSSIHPILISKDSRLLLKLFRQELLSRQMQAEFPYYAEPLSPASGIVSNLPVLLAEYTFRNEQDVKNYLSLLSQIPAYLKGIAAYETEKAQAGLFMSDAAADLIIQQCYEIMDAKKLLQDSHFLNTTFSERLQELVHKKLLTIEKANSYEKQNHLLLLTQIMPAYELLGDEIRTLKGSGQNCEGLAHLPKGREYYAFLFQETTGSHRSLNDIKALLARQMKQDAKALSQLLNRNPALLNAPLEKEFPNMSPEKCLADLQMRMQENFPAFPDTKIVPSHTVKIVSESLEDYCAPAFYLTPPIDDISENSIYINPKGEPDALELYTTLAHEGYPGHLYQTVYHHLYEQKKKLSPSRSLLQYSGYSEGWALYVEMLSYDYAKELLKEHGASPDTLLLTDVLRLNRSIQLCLYSLLDIEIHYDGVSLSSVSGYLKDFGITDPAIVKDIYEYIVQEPANYPKYYVGYLEFLLLKEEAKRQWKETYSDLRFHKFVLESGPCPFFLLEDRL